MSGGLKIGFDRSDSMVIVRPTGVLDAHAGEYLRDALLDLLADQVAGIVLDVDELRVVDPSAPGIAEVVAAVCAQNLVWPEIPLVLAGRDLTVSSVGPGIAVQPDRVTALAQLAGVVVPPRHHQRLSPHPDAPAQARAAVEAFCRRNSMCRGAALRPATDPRAGCDGPGLEAAQLVISELVTNAVMHAGTPIEVTLRLVPGVGGDLLHMGVRDSGPGSALVARSAEPTADSGRGLLVVEAFSESWGVLVSHIGKVVWATVGLRERL